MYKKKLKKRKKLYLKKELVLNLESTVLSIC